MTTALYKITREDGGSYRGGSGTWPLPPDADTPGAWWDLDEGRAKPKKLVACSYGLHLFEAPKILKWIGPALWEAEYEGEIVRDTDKVVVRKARLVRRIEAWNAKTLYLWAADCAERQLVNFEALYPDDKRPRQALDAVRGYAAGTVTLDELSAAAASAESARSAAWAAESAARAAESAESARPAAWAAAWASASAAWSAESAAAWASASAAWSAESAAEIDWQTAHLLALLGIGSA